MNKKFLDSILPPASEEDMVVALKVLIKEANEDVKKTAEKDPINQMVKDMWLKLQSDVFDSGLFSEFCDFFLEHPELNLIEIDREFREEWDI
jgi:hypothetical protein